MSDSIERVPGAFQDGTASDTAPRTTTPQTSWLGTLQPASWRGIPFAVRASEYRRGRRQAVHEYPKRDLPWAEDMGRASRIVGFAGFVVGDDCFAQAQALLVAAEQEGPGALVHPSLGNLTVSLVEPLTASERMELGRVVELRFEFVETGVPLYPSTSVSTQADVSDKADATNEASADQWNAFVNGTSPAAATTYTDSTGKQTTFPELVPAAGSTATPAYDQSSGTDTVRLFGSMATQQASDPGLTAGAATGSAPPPGSTFGRFDSVGSLSFDPVTVQQSLDGQVANRAAVSTAASSATSTASGG